MLTGGFQQIAGGTVLVNGGGGSGPTPQYCFSITTNGVTGNVPGQVALDGAGNPFLGDGNNSMRVAHLPPGTPLEVGATAAATANNQTLAGTAGKTTYITGFDISGLGATAGSTIAVTITGLTNTLTYYYTVPAGAAAAAPTWNVRFSPPIPASAANTAIVVNVPSFGTGNLNSAANAYGFQI